LLNASASAQEREMFELWPFEKLRSRKIESPNGKFLFVIVPQTTIEQYLADLRRVYLNSGQSNKWFDSYLRTPQPREVLRDERKSRKAYPTTGIYLKQEGTLIHSLKTFPSDIEKIYVADDGTHVSGINEQVILLNIRNDLDNEKLSRTDQPAFYSVSFGSEGTSICKKSLSDVLDPADEFTRMSEGFYWLSKEPVFDASNKTLTFIKSDGKIRIYDGLDCSVQLENDRVSTNSNDTSKPSYCLGVIALAFATLVSRGIIN
jgi:hypothetical protein